MQGAFGVPYHMDQLNTQRVRSLRGDPRWLTHSSSQVIKDEFHVLWNEGSAHRDVLPNVIVE